MNETQAPLSKRLGYRFEAPDLLLDALTHRSAGRRHNERLEFLGDAVLGLIIATELYHRRPEAREGVLTRWRASLVKRTTVAAVAREIQLGEHLVLGCGEQKTGGHRRESILADGLEAVLGAVYLDGGFAATREVVTRLYAGRLEALPEARALKDSKTRLQELLQGQGRALPSYRVVETAGKPHEQQFTVGCRVEGLDEVLATASSRRRAEQAAARRLLEQLEAEAV